MRSAEGNLQKFIWTLLGIVAAFALMSWYPQFSQGYEVKNQGALACNDAIKVARYGEKTVARDPKIRFIETTHRAGVQLTQDSFTMEAHKVPQSDKWKCTMEIHYPVDVEIWTIGPILDIKPIHFEKHLYVDQEVIGSY